jgi:very-short-patch-repair endonuclease
MARTAGTRSHRTMRNLPTAAIFTRADALACGWSDSALSRAVRSGRVAKLRRNQFTSIEHQNDPVLAAVAAARMCGGSVVSHRSAALFHGLPLLDAAPRRPDLTVNPRCTGDVAAALLHRATLRPEDVIEIDGTPVTSLTRTLVDLARTLPTSAAVVTIDAALHRGATDAHRLEDVRRACRGWPGVRKVPLALALCDPRAESPLESVSRLVIRRLRLPTPELQTSLHDDRGMFIGRVDFYWPTPGVVGEADGRSKYSSRAVLLEEKRRQQSLEEMGLVVVRWDWNDVTRRPQLLRERIERAFERGHVRDRSGFPRLWSIRAA